MTSSDGCGAPAGAGPLLRRAPRPATTYDEARALGDVDSVRRAILILERLGEQLPHPSAAPIRAD